MEQSPSWEANRSSVKRFPTFYGTWRFITAFASARDLSLTSARLIQSVPQPSQFLKISLNIILPSTPRYSKWSLSLSFPHQNPVCTSPVSHMPRFSWFYHLNIIWWVQSKSFSLCSLLHSPVTSFLLCPNIILSTLFLNPICLCFSLSVRVQVSHPYK